MTMSDSIEERGVHNPKVIDLVSFDREAKAVVLTMVESRPWGASPDQIKQVEDKFNSYLAYVAAGGLERDYPQYAGARVVFHLDCVEEPGQLESSFLDAVTEFAAGEKIGFVVRVRTDG
jgi:hypothetical protein